jgi:RHS repeat-associated protein
MRQGCILAFVTLSALLCEASAWAATGRTAGNFAVSADGSANYSIPIWTPPGVANLQPSLALNYSSRSGDGLLGIGWQLAGLSAISRCNLTYAQDGIAGSPQLASSDRFCFDGNRLRTTSGSTYGAPGATYQTEIANFSNVTSNGTAGSGPAWFKVQAKNGLTYEYGNTADSAILATGTSSVRIWALNAVRDRSGNAMTFTYVNDTTNGSYRPASIQYTYTGSSGNNNGYSVTFTYQSRPSSDQQWKYTIGGINNQLNYLNQITVMSGSTMVHGYTLNYVTSPTTNRLRISTIQECASSLTDCFPATSVAYQDGQKGWGAEIPDSGNATNFAYSMPMDVNGDGIEDLVYPDPASGHWYYELGTSAGTYAGPYDTGVASTNYLAALPIDFYANGKKDILVPNASGNWRVIQFVSAGAAFSYVDTTTSAAGVVAGSAMVGDVDGDGREDLIYAVSGGTGFAQSDYFYYRLNTGGGFSTTQGTLFALTNGAGCSPCVKLGNGQPFGNPIYRFSSQLRKIDFNGDGRADFLVYLASCTPEGVPSLCGNVNNPIVYTWTILLSQPNGTYVAADAIHWLAGAPNQPPLTADFNGDGCTDVAFVVSGVWNINFGTCGRAGSTTVLGPLVNTNVPFTAAPSLAIDWDGDGRADIVQAAAGANPDWLVARSLGNNLSASVDTGVPTGGTSAAKVTDVNGDGLGDMIYSLSTTALKTRVHSGVWPDLATGFTDAYGNSVSPSYVSITAQSNYFVWNDQAFPYENYLGPLYVVSAAQFTDPSNSTGGTYSLNYYYAGAALNLQGRGFTGFGNVQSHDSRNGVWETRGYSRAFPTIGMPNYDLKDPDNISTHAFYKSTNPVTYSTLDSTANNQRYFPYIPNITENLYEVAGTKIYQPITTKYTSFAFDSYGNATTVTTNVTDEDSGSPYYGDVWNSTTVSTIAPDASNNWCLSLPTQTTVTNSNNAPGGAAITRTVGYTPDYAKCRETVKVTEPNSTTYKVTEAYGFDSFGNINSDVVTGVGMPARTTLIDWGTSGQFPTTIKNPLSQSIILGFDPNTGMKTSQTDPNYTTANPLKTSWLYDTFGRKTQETRPDGTYTVWKYNDCAGYGGCPFGAHALAVSYYIYNTNNSIQNDGTTYFDTIDRPVVANTMNLSGGWNRNETRYDNLGRVQQQAMPCVWTSVPTLCPYWTTNSFDILNRLTQSQRPISATNSTLQTTLIEYAGRTTTVTDPQGKKTTKINLVTGSLARTQDHTGYYIGFKYDAFGSVLSVTDSLSNTLNTMTYDYGLQAFQRSSNDADLGPRSATYDALGEVTAYSDAKGQNFSVIYDALSRPTSRTEPDLTSTWTWGNTATSFNIGKLQSVTAASSVGTYSEVYGYDSKARLSTEQITIPGDTAYTYTRTYNATTGLLDTLQYPVSTSGYQLKLQYAYQNGILQQISDVATGTHYWTANAINPRGQYTQETLGNNVVVVNHALDAVTGWVSSIQAGVGGGAALQNNSYLFDEVGNLTQRQGNNSPGITENFYYDALYRLDHSTLNGAINQANTYDATGNVTQWAVFGGLPGNTMDYTTPQSGCTYYSNSQPHAVRSNTNGGTFYSMCYDANGNTLSQSTPQHPTWTMNFTWTSFNQPSGVSAFGDSSQFDYNADHQRYRQTATYSGSPETTIYVGTIMEKVSTSAGVQYRHYIPAGSNTVLYTRASTGTNSAYYIISDHLGSTTTITDSTGTLLASGNYSATGVIRNSTWNAAAPPLAPTITRHGFTGQEMVDNIGLVNFNGRLLDSSLGRMRSPDPYIPDPGNTQSFNRYSYVNNNPLSATDPTGFTQQRLPYCAKHEHCNGGDYSGFSRRGMPGGGSIGNSVYGTDVTSSGGFSSGFGSFDDGNGGGSLDSSGNGVYYTGLVDTSTSPPPASAAQNQTSSDQAAQGTDSASSLDYIAVTAVKYSFDPATGTVSAISGAIQGTSGLPGGPTSSGVYGVFNPDAAYEARRASDAAQAKGESGEAARQMDVYHYYCGCSSGPAYKDIRFPSPPQPPENAPPTGPIPFVPPN